MVIKWMRIGVKEVYNGEFYNILNYVIYVV